MGQTVGIWQESNKGVDVTHDLDTALTCLVSSMCGNLAHPAGIDIGICKIALF
jgi:hypothetical protein